MLHLCKDVILDCRTYVTVSYQLKKKIETMEKSSVSDRPWQLWGEIAADKRPENSLLQEDLDFEHTTRPGTIANTPPVQV